MKVVIDVAQAHVIEVAMEPLPQGRPDTVAVRSTVMVNYRQDLKLHLSDTPEWSRQDVNSLKFISNRHHI